MWDFLSKNCGIFSIEGGTKLWDFQHRGGDFRPLTSGHTVRHFVVVELPNLTKEFFRKTEAAGKEGKAAELSHPENDK